MIVNEIIMIYNYINSYLMMVAGSIKKEKIVLNERIKQVPKLTLKFEENSPEKKCLYENLKRVGEAFKKGERS